MVLSGSSGSRRCQSNIARRRDRGCGPAAGSRAKVQEVSSGAAVIGPRIRRFLCRSQIVSVLNGNLLRIDRTAGIASHWICFFGAKISHGLCALHWRRALYTLRTDLFDFHIGHPFFCSMYQERAAVPQFCTIFVFSFHFWIYLLFTEYLGSCKEADSSAYQGSLTEHRQPHSSLSGLTGIGLLPCLIRSRHGKRKRAN